MLCWIKLARARADELGSAAMGPKLSRVPAEECSADLSVVMTARFRVADGKLEAFAAAFAPVLRAPEADAAGADAAALYLSLGVDAPRSRAARRRRG